MRESFRLLAENRQAGDVLELPGVSIASLGARFQMFNAAYLSEPVQTPAELDDRLHYAAGHFRSRGARWSFWFCEDWLAAPVRRILSRRCERASLRLAADMPGMYAPALCAPRRATPSLECVRVDSDKRLADFHGIGSVCFHVPLMWFTEVFDHTMLDSRPRFACWVGYHEGVPVATAASVRTGNVLGLYNIATAPGHRRRGFGEAITRHVVTAEPPADALILQSTAQGVRLYENLGFRSVTRILVYNSVP